MQKSAEFQYRAELHATQDEFNQHQVSLGRTATLYARYEQEEVIYKQSQVVYERKQQSIRKEADVLYSVEESVIKDTWEIATAGVSDGTSREGGEEQEIPYPDTQLEQPPKKYLQSLYDVVGQTAQTSTEIVHFSAGFLWGIVKEIGNIFSLLLPSTWKNIWNGVSGFVTQLWTLVKEKGIAIDQVLGVVFDSIGNIPEAIRKQWDESSNFKKGGLTAATILTIIPASKRKQVVGTLQEGVVELKKLLNGLNKGEVLVGNNGKLIRSDGMSFFDDGGKVRKGGKVPSYFIDNLLTNPKSIANKSADEIASAFRDAGYKVDLRQMKTNRGEILLIEGHPKINTIKVHEGGGRHTLARTQILGNDFGKKLSIKVVKGSKQRYTGSIKEEVDAGTQFIFLEK